MTEEVVDIGGRRLRLISDGAGTPTVILEAGAGGFSAMWAAVQHDVARFTRVCSYDRAGYGRSDPPPVDEPRTSAPAVRDLRALLDAAKVEPPYVLVGHSLGGFHIRLFTSRYPEDVVGLVLVDADVEEEFTPVLPDEHRAGLRLMARMARVAQSMARIGLLQLAVRIRAPQKVRAMPDAAAREVLKRGFSITALRTLRSELANLGNSAAELRATQRDLGDRPLVVIRRGIPDGRLPGTSVEEAVEIEATLEQMQRRMAMWSRRGRVVVAQGSDHDIHVDEPDVVVRAIREVVQHARAAAGLNSKGKRLS
ncbi:MAG: alpha/beta hydrolase [Longimicrobiales bacterium]